MTASTARLRGDGVVNALVFGAFGAVALSRLFTSGSTPGTVGHVIALLVIAVLGYECASSGWRKSRVPGMIAFVAGWFWLPIISLVPLSVWWWIQRPAKRRDPELAAALASSGPLAGDHPGAALRSATARALDFLLFGLLALVGASRLILWELTPWTVIHVLALVAIAVLGYRYAVSGWQWRLWSGAAFALGWFWQPAVALVGLWFVGLRCSTRPAVGRRAAGESAPEASSLSSDISGPAAPPSREGAPAECSASEPESPSHGSRRVARAGLMVKILGAPELTVPGGDWGGRVKQTHARFRSRYGDGAVPAIVPGEHGERGLYFDVAPWTVAAQNECLQWLALLRTSDREDLEIEIRSDVDVPELVRFYAAYSLRVTFELEGMLAARWKEADAGQHNAGTLRRLAEKHLGRHIGWGDEGLWALDEMVLEFFRPDQPVLTSTVILIGSVFGEEIIARYGGRWLLNAEDPEEAAVEIPSPQGPIEVNVFGKVRKLYRNGLEDSMAAMARGIADIIARGTGPAPGSEGG